MTEARRALIVANLDYEDQRLQALRSPARDAKELVRVLGDPDIGAFDAEILLNESESTVSRQVAKFFSGAKRDDLLLLHFACHGVKDDDGNLYFAAADTELDNLDPTAVSAEFVNRQMVKSRSRRIVLLLDCCYSGAFGSGMVARGDDKVHLKERFSGRGRVVLTASNAMEYAWEGDDLSGSGQPSVFTTALVRGLETGVADRDGDGFISVEELYDYVYDQVQEATPNQTPGKWAFDVQGELVVAHTTPRTRQAPPRTDREEPVPAPQPEEAEKPGPERRAVRLPTGPIAASVVVVAAIVAVLFALSRGGTGALSSRKILFTSTSPDSSFDIYAIAADGSGRQRLTSAPGAKEYDPSWSPDGSRIAFVRTSSGSSAGDIFTMASDGTGETQVTATEEVERRPVWSPDGSQIAFVQSSNVDSPGDVYVIDADGANLSPVTSTPLAEGPPSWSNDGSRIVFSRSGQGVAGDIYSIGPDGSGEQQLTSTPEYERFPSWSPQDGQIAFIRAPDAVSPGDLYVMKANGARPQQLTSTPEAEDRPSWSPEGTYLAFRRATNLAARSDIYAIKSDGTGLRQVTSTEAAEYQVGW